jgi:sulfur carrier protein
MTPERAVALVFRYALSGQAMQIVVNDQPRDVCEGTTVADLLGQLEVASTHVAVEVNRELVPRGQHADCALNDGDRLEVVTLVGGG